MSFLTYSDCSQEAMTPCCVCSSEIFLLLVMWSCASSRFVNRCQLTRNKLHSHHWLFPSFLKTAQCRPNTLRNGYNGANARAQTAGAPALVPLRPKPMLRVPAFWDAPHHSLIASGHHVVSNDDNM